MTRVFEVALKRGSPSSFSTEGSALGRLGYAFGQPFGCCEARPQVWAAGLWRVGTVHTETLNVIAFGLRRFIGHPLGQQSGVLWAYAANKTSRSQRTQ